MNVQAQSDTKMELRVYTAAWINSVAVFIQSVSSVFTFHVKLAIITHPFYPLGYSLGEGRDFD